MKAADSEQDDRREPHADGLGDPAQPSRFAPAAEAGLADQSDRVWLRVVVETPRGSRVKYKFDEDLRAMTLKSVLPVGMVFPFNFGFVPKTLGGDGDPLDVLLLTEEPLFPGCVVTCRLLGALAVEQVVAGQTQRNDRLLAVPEVPDLYGALRSLEDLPESLLVQIEAFFEQYHRLGGKDSRTLAR